MTALTDANGNVVQKYAYDPWGARRNPDDWTQKDSRTFWILNWGYTGHEHLDAFGVINMNGRVYDPLTAQFLSCDPELQAPGDWLNYNRYSYCFGNPMRYVDPSGYETKDPMYMSNGDWLNKWYLEYLSSYSQAYAEWYGRQVGADGLTNEQWLNASRPGADPNLARDYRWQNQSAYNNVMSGMSNGSGFSVSGKSAQNAFRYMQSYYDSPTGGDGVLLPEVRVTGRNGYWNVDEFSLLDAWHAVNDYQFGGSATPGFQGEAAGGGGDYLQYEARFVNAYKTQGNLIWYNSSGDVVKTYPAVSGASNIKSYTIPEGTWNAGYLNTQTNPKYSLNDVSFRVTLGPDRYDPLRGRETGLIRIHPARSPGTEGCIGLRGDRENLLDFYNRYSNYYNTYGTIPVNVIYTK